MTVFLAGELKAAVEGTSLPIYNVVKYLGIHTPIVSGIHSPVV